MKKQMSKKSTEDWHFKIRSQDDAENFDSCIYHYLSQKIPQQIMENIHLVNLARAYDKLQESEHGGQVFSALLDLNINIASLLMECFVLAELDQNFETIKHGVRSLYESQEVFANKMDTFRYQFSFILRYRAIWDKFMGLSILYFRPDEYENFMRAKSRKKAFEKIVAKGTASDFFTHILNHLREFDDEFRTTETHGAGKIRKWTFTARSIFTTPSEKLIVSCIPDHLMNMLSILNAMFGSAPTP